MIVWMGSTAPGDPSYTQDTRLSGSDYANGASGCYSSGCEPSCVFPGGTSPQCEGWGRSQDGNGTHSIAGLARSSPTCTDSVGAVCTVDTIDLSTTPTDPYSQRWPTDIAGGGPGGPLVPQHVDRVLLAGCDMGEATGGTWNGPEFFRCPGGAQGTLQYVAHGPQTSPNLDNPTLFTPSRRSALGRS